MSMKAKTQAESPQEIALAQKSAEQWADFKTRYIPQEKAFAKDVAHIKEERKVATGVANADNAQAFDAATEQNVQAQYTRGVKAGSGRDLGLRASMGVARGKSGAKATVAASNDVDNRSAAGQLKMVSLGRNLANSANLGLRNQASMGFATAANDVRLATEKGNQQAQLVGTVSGGIIAGLTRGGGGGGGDPGLTPAGAASLDESMFKDAGQFQ